ncbi:MAG TPA: Asp-tRNA(Asn)/Glu-tRNA(Gln) amidotransferase subunit GatC [Gemmatimonas sp.]|nr:Asp-tRNA(Asn)/Glu-tRNA(Gln) amidotransferase subunit GatC [Gemmatimonas sp.]
MSEQDVRHIAALARLELDDARTETLVRELNGILAHMDVLQAVDMTIEDSDKALDADTALDAQADAVLLRADIASPLPLAAERASFAPNYEDGFFLVPRLSTHE